MMLLDLILSGAFVFILYVSGQLCRIVSLPPLVCEVCAGVAFGPHALSIIPDSLQYGMESLGFFGVLLLVFEGGVGTDIELLLARGWRCFTLALTGTVFPVVLGWASFLALGYGSGPGLAAGTALSSTAIGFTLQLMQDSAILDTELGQIITAAAIIDDVMSLAVLATLQSISRSTAVKALDIILPVIVSVAACIAASILRMGLRRAPLSVQHRLQQNAGISFVFCLIALLAWAADVSGSSSLLGAYLAGVVAAAHPPMCRLFAEHIVIVQRWSVTLFFGAFVAAAVPVKQLADTTAILHGLVVTAAAIVGKFVSGLWAAPLKRTDYSACATVVGCAMIGRGELGFVIARQAVVDGLVSETGAAAVSVALLLATALGPILFRVSMAKYRQIPSLQQLRTADQGCSVTSARPEDDGVNGEIADRQHSSSRQNNITLSDQNIEIIERRAEQV